MDSVVAQFKIFPDARCFRGLPFAGQNLPEMEVIEAIVWDIPEGLTWSREFIGLRYTRRDVVEGALDDAPPAHFILINRPAVPSDGFVVFIKYLP